VVVKSRDMYAAAERTKRFRKCGAFAFGT